MNCPLCESNNFLEYDIIKSRVYNLCSACGLLYLDKRFHLNSEEEKKRYDQHINDPNDERYRKFLSRIFTPLNNLLRPCSYGLDFGSGPGPTLSKMFEERKHRVEIYDKFYADDKSVFNNLYDFITSTEVIEHLFNPKNEIEMLLTRLKSNGHIAFMTKFFSKEIEFKTWYYKDDPTHVCFYSENSFRWIAKRYKLDIEVLKDDVVIYKKRL